MHAFVGQCRAGDAAAQLLQRLRAVRLPGHGALQCQNLLAGTRTEGDAVSAGCSLRWPEHEDLSSRSDIQV